MGPALVAAVFVFVAVLSLVLALSGGRTGHDVERRLSQLKVRTSEARVENVLRGDSGTFPFLHRILTGSAWSENAERQLVQAGWNLKVSEYLLMRLLVAAALGGAVALVFRGSSLAILIGAGAGAAGFMLPAWILSYFRGARIAAVNRQLAETLTLISNSLRSGFAFTQSVELASRQVGRPIRDELTHFLRDVALGSPTDSALEAMAERTASYDLEMMVATVLVQRSTGGNLSEILDNVAETIGERERIAGEIRALTASQRLTGLILSIYPVFLFVVFYLLAPDLMKVLWQEPVGRLLLVVAVGLQVVGMLTIRRILRPEI